jgi:hypothetical protein
MNGGSQSNRKLIDRLFGSGWLYVLLPLEFDLYPDRPFRRHHVLPTGYVLCSDTAQYAYNQLQQYPLDTSRPGGVATHQN